MKLKNDEQSLSTALFKIASLTTLLLIAISTRASIAEFDYYKEHLSSLQKSKDKDLISNLYKAISNNKRLSYKQARTHLFGDIYLDNDNGKYTIKDVYCEKTFGQSAGVGPGRIPNHQVLNCEHTWPQSRFSSRESSSMQKGDLHHLYPTDSRANSTRGNIPFGEVDGEEVTGCPLSERGDDIYRGISSFEPPKYHKGNVARALFYFSVRYRISINDTEEVFLKQWHRDDPVDQDEIRRNEKIYQIQGNRNPFIDDPELVDQIDNF